MSFETLKVHTQDSICFVQFDRPQANNTINDRLIAECAQVLDDCEQSATVVVLSGSAETFCMGADFATLSSAGADAREYHGPGALYDLWLRLARGSYVSIARVRGKANAGGLGFVAASDIVLADDTAQFSLSELLFGVYPACVLPFLIRRVGVQRAHYLTLMTRPIAARQACEWGLVDAHEPNSEVLLRQHLLRLRRLSKKAIGRYKRYLAVISQPLEQLKATAVAANIEAFADPDNFAAITRYVEHGLFPWEKQ